MIRCNVPLLGFALAIFFAAAMVCQSGCNRKSPPAHVLFEFSDTFHGPITICNVSGASNPVVLPDGTLKMIIIVDPDRPPTYDFARWPEWYQARARLKSGEPVESTFFEPNAKYYLGQFTCDGEGNMIFEMKNK